MSLPLAYRTSARMMMSPMYWAVSSTRSLTLRPVSISQKVKMACPPSSPGMGRMFMTASMMERKAVVIQNPSQFQLPGKMLPMAMKPPSSS